jgi:arylsulfatase A-like enzyme
MTLVTSRASSRDRSCRQLWARITVAGALLASAVDAVLLQQKKAFFTGGFLATSYTRSAAEAAVFLATSFLVDAAAVGVFVLAALWISSRLRLSQPARVAFTFGCGVAPLLLTDFFSYQLLSYLGGAFDFGLMFDLTGRRPSEILAVSAGHLGRPAWLLAVVAAVAAGIVWGANFLKPATRQTLRVTGMTVLAAALLALCGGVATVVASTASETMQDGLLRKPSGQFFSAIAEKLTDFDRDGYGMTGRMVDPAPLDAAIFPYAVDRPGDGVDQDGVGGDLPVGAPYVEDRPAQVWKSRPNVLLVVLESFRADALGRTINGTPVTPVLDGIGARGVSASLAFSQNGYTAQSRFHVLSGSLAGLRGNRSLIDDFKANGYEVAYFSGQDDSFGGPEYAVGFDRADVAYDARQDRKNRYSTFSTAGSLAVPFSRVQEKIGDFLERRDRSRPLFLYVNFEDTHYPYHHDGLASLVSSVVVSESSIDSAHRNAVREMYYNTAANVDHAVGATIDMATRALGAVPAVIVTGDHGESLFDEGFLGHGYALNDAQTRIPLVAAGVPIEIAEPFGQSDLRDAIGDALMSDNAAHTPPRVARPQGRRIFQYLGTLGRPRQIAFLTSEGRTIYDFRTRRVSIRSGDWQRPEELESDGRQQFRALIQFWERMMLARSEARHALRP